MAQGREGVAATASRRALLVGAGGLAGSGGATPSRAAPRGKAGLLITGQSNAGFFLADGGIWTMNEGLAALLGLPRAWFDPRLNGFNRIDGYALEQGAHREPAMDTVRGGTPLWAPGDAGAFLAHRPGIDPANWPRGESGRALDRFVTQLLTGQDRADCLGMLWLQTENDSQRLRMGDAAIHAAAIRRHLALTRAAFGRPATGPGALPVWFWTPIPFGNSAEGHRALRLALAQVAAEPGQAFRLGIPQTADSEPRGGSDWSHRDAPDLRAFSRRAAYAIARDLGGGRGVLPGPGPRIDRAQAAGPAATLVIVAHDRGRALRGNAAALDGRGWTVLEGEAARRVTGVALQGADRLLLRHEPCTAGATRVVGYCLLGQQLGRGNAITDDWATGLGAPGLPPGLGAEWRFDLPLQATLLPVPVAG